MRTLGLKRADTLYGGFMNVLDSFLKRKPVSRIAVVAGLVFVLLGVLASSAILNSLGWAVILAAAVLGAFSEV